MQDMTWFGSIAWNEEALDSAASYCRVPMSSSLDLASHIRQDGIQYRVGHSPGAESKYWGAVPACFCSRALTLLLFNVIWHLTAKRLCALTLPVLMRWNASPQRCSSIRQICTSRLTCRLQQGQQYRRGHWVCNGVLK